MRRFDTRVQLLKYRVLREVSRYALSGKLARAGLEIPETIINGTEPTMRCCVYKERAIVGQRIGLAMGGDRMDPNIVEVLDIACDECPVGGYTITEACRGCIAHRCETVCKFGAITFDKMQKGHINKDKCVECGRCASQCPYSAIANNKRPCEKACLAGAISMDDNKKARIDHQLCTSCGACVYQCPFGAVMDKSYILDVVDLIQLRQKREFPLVALVAPSLASQFGEPDLGRVVAGIRALGFDQVVETAWGADLVVWEEARELAEENLLISSCCPAFVSYARSRFPELGKHISGMPSPMVAAARKIREDKPDARVVFIGPCTAKKKEMLDQSAGRAVDSVLTFEELQALIDSMDIQMEALAPVSLEGATAFGRGLAKGGGLSLAVRQALKEQGLDGLAVDMVQAEGIEECKKALKAIAGNPKNKTFLEGMACSGGCVGGAGCLTHEARSGRRVDHYSKASQIGTIADSVGSPGSKGDVRMLPSDTLEGAGSKMESRDSESVALKN